MATKKFPSELSLRGTVLVTDKLLIHNITTGATSYCTVADLFANPVFTGITQVADLQITKATNPRSYIKDSAASGDEKEYFFQSSGGILAGYAINDVRSALSQWLGVGRTGVTINKVWFPNGNVIIGGSVPTSKFQVVGLPVYNDNANAAASGLTAGAFYRTGETLKVVY